MKMKYIMYDIDTFKTKKTISEKIEWSLICLKWQSYSILHLGKIVEVKIALSKMKAFLGLRKPVELDMEFPEREWDTDIYG